MISASTTFLKLALLFSAAFFYVSSIWAADHIQVRTIMIESQLSQVKTTGVLITGDSIIESWLAPPIVACDAINAGLGGGGVSHVKALLLSIKEKGLSAKLGGIIIAIGVNDSQHRDFPANYLDNWKRDYESMLNIALQLNPSVSVSTILPVEKGMPLGTKYFDQSIIDSMNSIIRKFAQIKNIHLIDANKVFRENGTRHFTVDGVHLTPDAYTIFTRQILTGIPRSCYSGVSENKPKRRNFPTSGH